MALCTQLDVEQKLQWDITSEPDATVTALIADAQAHMEAEVGRPLESDDYTNETFDGGRVALFLKHWPVTGVSAVTEDGESLTDNVDFMWQENGRLIRVSGGYQTHWRTRKPQSILVSYTGGHLSPDHDSELEHLGSICAEVVARAFFRGAKTAASGSSDVLAEIQSVTLDGRGTVTYSTSGGESFSLTGGLLRFVLLDEDEQRQLGRYKDAPFV